MNIYKSLPDSHQYCESIRPHANAVFIFQKNLLFVVLLFVTLISQLTPSNFMTFFLLFSMSILLKFSCLQIWVNLLILILFL